MTHIKGRFFLGAAIAAAVFFSAVRLAAAATDDDSKVLPAGRQAVFSGMVKDIDPTEMTINYMGEDVVIDADALTQGGLGDLDDFYDEGSFVTVEGTMVDENRVIASRLIKGGMPYAYNYDNYDPDEPDVPPFIVNSPGIITADDLN